jgi:ABC-type lipoprotein export system ATPase subunit/GNAT superfamily N-acetyltransferase
MPTFNIIRQSEPKKSFRVASIIGKFDLESNKIVEEFSGNIEIPEKWNIGLIVGKSGTGKTTIAKELFPDSYVTDFQYNKDNILDDMPENKSVEDITSMFNSVGFSSPPSWLKKYNDLSNGQKMRVNLAHSLLLDKELIVFDEFTSVVDRQVAQIGSFAIQKAVRKQDKKFIAVTCHYDVQDWLLPDWIFNTDTMTFHLLNEGQKKNRPNIKFEIFQTADKTIWKMFAKHHYLSHTHNNASSVYIALINDEIAGFLSVLHFPHPIAKNIKRVHRLVILPDYQGAGFGIKFLEEIGYLYKNQKFRYSIVTSSPSLINALKKSNKWRCVEYGRKLGFALTGVIHNAKNKNSRDRITASFELK